jgi:hypothetical protein
LHLEPDDQRGQQLQGMIPARDENLFLYSPNFPGANSDHRRTHALHSLLDFDFFIQRRIKKIESKIYKNIHSSSNGSELSRSTAFGIADITALLIK